MHPVADDLRSTKELLMNILEKSKATLPEVAVLMQRAESGKIQAPTPKVRKKDCLNPRFLVQLGECGEKIRVVLCEAMERIGGETLRKYHDEYMAVIAEIRKYHEDAHLSHDIHVNSTTMKENLLKELKKESKRSEDLEKKLRQCERTIAQQKLKMEDLSKKTSPGDTGEHINISQISQISKQGRQYGHFYGGDENVGQLQPSQQQMGQKVAQLEQKLKEQQKKHQDELDAQREEIAELELQFEELRRESETTQIRNQQKNEVSLPDFEVEETPKGDEDLWRMLMVQACTVEEYLQQDHY